MSLADDLLAQGKTLATIDSGIPSQANLRRSISSSYYALFHLLIAEAASRFIPASPPGLRARVSRSFGHGEMKQICSRFSSKRIPDEISLLLHSRISLELLSITETFVDLQEDRHLADYDVGLSFERGDALLSIGQARRAFTQWNLIRDTDEATVFLAALAFGARWAK